MREMSLSCSELYVVISTPRVRIRNILHMCVQLISVKRILPLPPSPLAAVAAAAAATTTTTTPSSGLSSSSSSHRHHRRRRRRHRHQRSYYLETPSTVDYDHPPHQYRHRSPL
jgi:hypothetical protein